MGAKKRKRAEQLKELKKTTYSAELKNCPTSPRKMRLVADMIRGNEVNNALDKLRYNAKEASGRLEKLVLSAVANWQAKNENVRLEDSKLIIKEIYVNQARTLKRIQPAPQGRAYRIRKRSNHVTVVLGDQNEKEKETTGKKEVNDTQTK
ncbi:MAG: 50S ribosomal protein L22 [Bacteroidales bacterium]|jgi:large subunit ribosomal protein L22|nr:50S ribosomal protein L22 [Bacteroidales bacterium]